MDTSLSGVYYSFELEKPLIGLIGISSIKNIQFTFTRKSRNSYKEFVAGASIASRVAYGNALVKLGEACDRIVVLDADTKNSTFALKFKNV